MADRYCISNRLSAVSVVIEFLKEVLRYNHLTIKIEKKLHGMISNE